MTQPLNLQSDLLVSKFASKFNWYRYDEEETNPKAETWGSDDFKSIRRMIAQAGRVAAAATAASGHGAHAAKLGASPSEEEAKEEGEEERDTEEEKKQGLEGLDGLTDSETPINVSGGDDVLNETDGTVNDTESGLGMTMIRLGYRARNFEVGESSCRAPCGCVRRAGSNFWWGCTTS